MTVSSRLRSPTPGWRRKGELYRGFDLDNVYLLNGFTIENAPDGERMVISEPESLHSAVADHIVLTRNALSPQEFRFLRRQMGLTQVKIALALGTTTQTIARYEKGQTKIPGPMARCVRVLYAFKAVPMRERLAWLERIYRTLERHPEPEGALRFQLTQKGWVEVDEAIEP